MRGASAIETLLSRHPGWKLRVLAVWEPILPTDWRSPTSGALARLHDPRVIQFWDPNHLISATLSRDRQGRQPQPACCRSRGYYWDDAILFAPHARWKEAPASAFWDGPVVESIDRIAGALASQSEK